MFGSIGAGYLGGWLSQHNLGIYGFAGAGVISVFQFIAAIYMSKDLENSEAVLAK